MTKEFILKSFWAGRAVLLKSFWAGRAVLLKSFWAGRAVAYKCYFWIRSIPHRARRLLFTLLDSKFGQNVYVVRFIRNLRLRKNRILGVKNRILLLKYGQLYNVINVKNYSGNNLVFSKNISPSEKLSFSSPSFFFDSVKVREELEIPFVTRDVIYRIFQDVTVVGRSELIIVDQDLILPSGYNAETDVLPIELSGELSFSNTRNNARLLNKNSSRHFEEAIHLLGSLTGNYAHWILEFLPKIIAFDKLDVSPKTPILVDEWIHPRFFESLEFFMSDKREVIKVSKYERISISKVHFLDNFSYIPPQDREFLMTGIPPVPNADRYSFSTLGLSILRSQTKFEGESVHLHEKLMLLRTEKTSGNRRQITNIAQLIEVARNHGYFVVDPAELTFQEQVELFRNARYVISPLGAAMANLVFTTRGCKVIGLSPHFQNGDYFYFSMLNSILGHEFTYLLGKPTSGDKNNFNSDFEIQIFEFKKLLESFHLG